MPPTLAELFAAHQTSLKIEWTRLLREAAPTSPLAHPDILLYRMDDTLRSVEALLRDPRLPNWPERCPPIEQLRATCRCGLNPLLDYFLTGSTALRTVFRVGQTEQLHLDQAWYVVAHRELGLLCSICQRERRSSGAPFELPS